MFSAVGVRSVCLNNDGAGCMLVRFPFTSAIYFTRRTPIVDGCEIRSHHFEAMVEVIVCRGIESFQGFFCGAGFPVAATLRYVWILWAPEGTYVLFS